MTEHGIGSRKMKDSHGDQLSHVGSLLYVRLKSAPRYMAHEHGNQIDIQIRIAAPATVQMPTAAVEAIATLTGSCDHAQHTMPTTTRTNPTAAMDIERAYACSRRAIGGLRM